MLCVTGSIRKSGMMVDAHTPTSLAQLPPPRSATWNADGPSGPGADCSEASMDEFYQWLGVSKSKKIRLAVMEWTCGNRSATRRASRSTHPKPPACSTSSLCCSISARHWTPCVRPSIAGGREKPRFSKHVYSKPETHGDACLGYGCRR